MATGGSCGRCVARESRPPGARIVAWLREPLRNAVTLPGRWVVKPAARLAGPPARRPGGLGWSGSPCLAGCFEPEFEDRGLAHLELLYLARDGHGEVTGEPDVTRDLMVRDLATAVLPDMIS